MNVFKKVQFVFIIKPTKKISDGQAIPIVYFKNFLFNEQRHKFFRGYFLYRRVEGEEIPYDLVDSADCVQLFFRELYHLLHGK
jgi:hypothetical protein